MSSTKHIYVVTVTHVNIFCLKAHILATETRESEIALTLCRLIWKQALPNERCPKVSTPAELCYELDGLKLTLNLPKLAILLTECETPTPEAIAFCRKLSDTIAIAWLTNEPLEAPLKGFPPASTQPLICHSNLVRGELRRL